MTSQDIFPGCCQTLSRKLGELHDIFPGPKASPGMRLASFPKSISESKGSGMLRGALYMIIRPLTFDLLQSGSCPFAGGLLAEPLLQRYLPNYMLIALSQGST